MKKLFLNKNCMPDLSYFNNIFSPYIDPKWTPYVLIGAAILVLLLVYIIFSYIRAFISWITGNSEIISLQKTQNGLLEDLISLQNEQLSLMEALFIENSDDEFSEEEEENMENENEEWWKNKTNNEIEEKDSKKNKAKKDEAKKVQNIDNDDEVEILDFNKK